MTNLIVSMIRFSAALTLYSVEQLEQSMNASVSAVEGGSELGKTVDGFGKTLDSLTDVLMKDMDQKKRETLDSVAKASQEVVHRTMEGMDMMDPRQVLKASSDLVQKTSEVTAKWVSKAAEAVEKATEGSKTAPEPQPAAGR